MTFYSGTYTHKWINGKLHMFRDGVTVGIYTIEELKKIKNEIGC